MSQGNLRHDRLDHRLPVNGSQNYQFVVLTLLGNLVCAITDQLFVKSFFPFSLS